MDLVSAEWLLAHLDDPDLRIADVRWYLTQPGQGAVAYAEGHIPGAIFVDVPTVLAGREGPGRHPLPDPRDFVAALGALGIGDEHVVVAYDDAGGANAARLWWMLENVGHERAAVLDGGLGAWLAAGGPTTPAVPRWPRATLLTRVTSWQRTMTRDALRERLGEVTLLDARAPERYRGEVEPVDPVAGHIPTARSAPSEGYLASDGRFLSPAKLFRRFEELGATTGDVVTSCGSGITACHTALAMRVARLPDPYLYPGSYSDWSRSGLAIATGPEPGEPPAADRHGTDGL